VEAVVSYAEPLATQVIRSRTSGEIIIPLKAGRVNNMAVFLVFWISPAVNPTKSFKYLAEKGYCWFLESFAMLFMQLKG